MRRIASHLCLAVLLSAPPLAAQEAPTHVYLAYFRIGYADMDEWNRQYWEYSVPILDDLQGEGMIEGYNQWQHDVGGEYNVRFAVRTYDWASLGTFWSEYLGRLEEVAPGDGMGGMIQEHYDEIWNIADVHMPADAPVADRILESTFRHRFADEEEWAGIWSDVAAPILQDAMDEGLLIGWVRMEHNTGGPHNSKVLYFFEEWDHMDDLFEKLLGGMAEDQETWNRTMSLFQAHDDVIWIPTPEPSM